MGGGRKEGGEGLIPSPLVMSSMKEIFQHVLKIIFKFIPLRLKNGIKMKDSRSCPKPSDVIT